MTIKQLNKANPACINCGATENTELRLDQQRGYRRFCKVDTLEQLRACLRRYFAQREAI